MKLFRQSVKTAYVGREIALSRLSRRPALTILFSTHESWEPSFRRFFPYTRHQIEFGQITPACLGRYDLVVPLNLPDALLIADQSPSSAGPFVHPSRSAVELLDDKRAFNQFVIANGHSAQIPSQDRPLDFPFIVKRIHDAYSLHCHLIANSADAALHAAEISSPDYLVQQFIPGREECATHLYFRDGRVIAHLGTRYHFSHDHPVKAKDMPLFTALYRCPHLDLWARLLTRAGFQGLCCVNYKMHNGRPFLLEINPRMGGSLALYFFSFLRRIQNKR